MRFLQGKVGGRGVGGRKVGKKSCYTYVPIDVYVYSPPHGTCTKAYISVRFVHTEESWRLRKMAATPKVPLARWRPLSFRFRSTSIWGKNRAVGEQNDGKNVKIRGGQTRNLQRDNINERTLAIDGATSSSSWDVGKGKRRNEFQASQRHRGIYQFFLFVQCFDSLRLFLRLVRDDTQSRIVRSRIAVVTLLRTWNWNAADGHALTH